VNNSIDVFECPENRLLNSKQTALYLGYKVSYLYNLVHRGELRPYKAGGKAKGSLRFLKSDLDKYLGRPNGVHKT